MIRNAFVRARGTHRGINLGLSRIGVKIWWQGYGGMALKDVERTIKVMLEYEDPPTYLVLHVGGNDLGKIKVGFLRNELKNTIRKLSELLPSTKFIWSQILPRLKWRFSKKNDCMDKARLRINNSISSFVIRKGGHCIRYPDIVPDHRFFNEDGVHLTDLGNEVFLNTLQGAFETFVKYGIPTSPC